MPYNKIVTQLRPVVRLLEWFGGYPIAEKCRARKVKQAANSLYNTYWGFGSDVIRNERFKENELYLSKLRYITKARKSLSKAKSLVECDDYYELTTFNFELPRTWYAYCLKILTVLCMVTFLFNLALGIPFPLNTVTFSSEYTNRISSCLMFLNSAQMTATSIFKVLEVLTLFSNAGLFVQWLNNWSRFEREFFNSFKRTKRFTLDIRKFRNTVLIFYFGIPGSLLISSSLFGLKSMYVFHIEYVSKLWLLFATTFTWVYNHLEDCKYIIIFRTTRMTLEQIRLGIQESYNSSSFFPSPSDIAGWRGLIQMTRQQTSLVCSYLKSQQLIFVCETTVAGTLGLSFLLFRDPGEDILSQVSSPLFIAIAYYCCNNFVRLYLKVLLADQIPAEELRIAEVVLEIEGECTHGASKHELKYLYTLLTQNTVQLNLGNYLTLKKQLVLQVCGQVVAYMIVIKQFQDNLSNS